MLRFQPYSASQPQVMDPEPRRLPLSVSKSTAHGPALLLRNPFRQGGLTAPTPGAAARTQNRLLCFPPEYSWGMPPSWGSPHPGTNWRVSAKVPEVRATLRNISAARLQRVGRGCHWDGFTAQLTQSSTLPPSFFLTNSLYTHLCHGACLLGKPQQPLPLTCNARGSSPQGRRGGTPHGHSCYGLGSKTDLLEGPSLKPAQLQSFQEPPLEARLLQKARPL